MSDTQFVQIQKSEKYAEKEFWEMVVALDAGKWMNLLPPQISIEDLSSKREKSFITPVDAPIPDCLMCGACCTFLFIVGVEPNSDAPAETIWNVTDESGEVIVDSYLKRDAETLFCTALQPTADGKMPCGIYEKRPLTCRKFEAGSDKCHALRRIYGYEPFLTLDEMSAALKVLKIKESERISLETIRDAKIVKTKDGDCEIVAEMQNGTKQKIHKFKPNSEEFRQHQFFGLTLAQAQNLIEAQNNVPKI